MDAALDSNHLLFHSTKSTVIGDASVITRFSFLPSLEPCGVATVMDGSRWRFASRNYRRSPIERFVTEEYSTEVRTMPHDEALTAVAFADLHISRCLAAGMPVAISRVDAIDYRIAVQVRRLANILIPYPCKTGCGRFRWQVVGIGKEFSRHFRVNTLRLMPGNVQLVAPTCLL